MNKDELHDYYASTVTAIAVKVGRMYRSYTSIEDVQQELWAWIYTYPEPFLKYARNGVLAPAKVALGQAAHKYCESQRTAQRSPEVEAPELYSLGAIRELLLDCFDYEDWQSFAQQGDGMPKAKRIEATSDRLAMLVDVKAALEKLPDREYNILVGRYKYQYGDEQMADMLEIAPASVKMTVARAVKTLASLLNPTDVSHEHISRRRVKSNASARAEASNAWEGI